jgi:hypothetical protein
LTSGLKVAIIAGMGMTFGNLLSDEDWSPMLEGATPTGKPISAANPNYLWIDGGPLAEAPVDFDATFGGAMWTAVERIDVPAFNRNPLRVRPHFTVPRHHHNMDEMILVFQGEYSIEYGDQGEQQTIRVGPGQFFRSHAGTPYTMTAGPEGVTYIETWPEHVNQLQTVWHDVGWVHR